MHTYCQGNFFLLAFHFISALFELTKKHFNQFQFTKTTPV